MRIRQLLDHLNTAPLKELAIAEAERFLADAKTQLRLTTKKSRDAWNKEYALSSKEDAVIPAVAPDGSCGLKARRPYQNDSNGSLV